MTRRLLAVLATVGLLAATAACTPEPDRDEVPNKPPVTDGVPDELLSFYEQQPEWEDCADGFECATIDAPRDWANPDDGTIELAMTRPADRPAEPKSSLLVNPGGPGGSGIEYVQSSIDYDGFGEALLDTFDIVGFDPRGVGESTPVTCLDADAMDAYLYDIPSGTRGSDEWEADLEASAKTFAEGCDDSSGDLLPFITTEQSARDMDLLRGVLGDTKLDYLGFSYGTFLGATYAELFPENTGNLVLDGAMDPAVSSSEVGRSQVVAFEKSLGSYLEACLDSSACPFRGTLDQAYDGVASLLARLDRSPLPTQDGRELGGDAMMLGIVVALYNEQNWPTLTEALSGASEGDPEMAMYLADFYNERAQGGGYLSNSTEAFTAYNCMDYPVETEEQYQADEEYLAENAPITWQYMLGADPCQYWPVPPTGERGEITAAGAAPILVVGTTGDPATPFAWAEALADELESGQLLTREGEGHTAYGSGSACIDDAIESFLIDGTMPEEGLVCS
ncbi:proteinase [Microbacterium sorbitolivorans]|uniref:Alpha/beta hydrolase n=1 Tax=Microbacterium sorbitolivorans TaxID=1867410 RepID=A0A367XV65_9MICO|nr:alpha/beta hydrolase [Microbacterium sorbitolivorans]RCK57110.1 alpha/beta hydrolase [Microbacterium sorbitolivorans]GGF46591.1 proteinase [Microbacterium sorbitolivorans]